MKNRSTVTFQPAPEVEKKLKELRKKGHGAMSDCINQALRQSLCAVIEKYDKFRTGGSFNAADAQPVSLAA